MKAIHKMHFRLAVVSVIFFIVGLTPSPVMGQGVLKRQLTPEDYKLWGTLHTQCISSDGTWVSYHMTYESGMDTLFVKGTTGQATYALPKAADGRFIGSSRFAYRSSEADLHIIDLSGGKKDSYSNVLRYDIGTHGNYLVTMEKSGSDNGMLVIRRNNGQVLRQIENVTGYTMNNSEDALLYTARQNDGYSIGIIKLNNKCDNIVIASGASHPFVELTWKDDGDAVAFLGTGSNTVSVENKLYLYRMNTGKLFTLSRDRLKDFPSGLKIASASDLKIKISGDGKKVFFTLEDSAEGQLFNTPGNVEIWNSDDKILYPMQQIISSYGKKTKVLGVWYPDRERVSSISNQKQQWVCLTGDLQHALIAGSHENEVKYKAVPDMDYCITNISTGESVPFLAGYSGQTAQISVSPDGKYIAYYKDSNWWLYDIRLKKHNNITLGLDAVWDNKATDPSNAFAVFGAPGWGDDGSLFLYDEYDVWLVSQEGKTRKRLTPGREQKLRFRLADNNTKPLQYSNYSGAPVTQYNLGRDIYMSCLNTLTNATGYYTLSPYMRLQVLVMGDNDISNLKLSEDGNDFAFEEQAYDISPRIIHSKKGSQGTKTIAESNTQQNQFQWGSSRVIHYAVKGKSLNGALFYPAGYSQGKTYPMVVYIYEIMSRAVNKYVNPSQYNIIGFNITNLTSKGYLVLLPDINYGASEPGFSATDCVEAAVKHVIDMGIVTANKIGLTGHSFGGYETNFILTQSRLFAAAVSGASVSDVVSSYFAYGASGGIIDYWRYENHQFRIRKPFYDDPVVYLQNSPLFHAKDITTPILSWAGKDDDIVRSQQTMELYAALRRLDKKNVMLLYPGEGHALTKPENQIDLTQRVEEWFGYLLKDEKKPEWIVE